MVKVSEARLVEFGVLSRVAGGAGRSQENKRGCGTQQAIFKGAIILF